MTAVRDVIRAVAEGATEGLIALRGAGLRVEVHAFDVEVDYAGGAGDPGEVSATLRLRFVTRTGPGHPVLLPAPSRPFG